ncbi:hypothetical protein Avbf_09825 [Armadillidium vulgare]|nr:hypothetical protein Avbf_09825 [Armadillidium vulgare]
MKIQREKIYVEHLLHLMRQNTLQLIVYKKKLIHQEYFV